VTSLHVVAHLRGAIMASSAHVALDGLLAAAVAMRDGLPPPPPLVNVEIPLQRSSCGRVYLATSGVSRDDDHELRYLNKRFPLAEAQILGSSIKRVNMASGPSRSYRIPQDTCHLVNDEIHWWAIGDAHDVEALLVGWIGYLGRKRSVGLGRVVHWHVEECEPWGDGFPCVRDGQPMRPLPVDWPGLGAEVERAYSCIAPPYWRHAEAQECAVPSWT
jgi:hypothetical protein